MSHRCLTVLLVAFGCAGISFATASDDPPDPAALARKAWAITDVVLANHLAPPPRAEMLVAGVQSMVEKADAKLSTEQRDKIAKVANADQLADILRDAWPKTDEPAEIADALFQGLLPQQFGPGDRVIDARDPIINPADAKIQEQIAQNRYVGTGIQIRLNEKEDYVEIGLAFAGGPARRAGAKANDLIVEVDGVNMKGKTTQDLVKALRGEEGTDVTIVVRQPDAKETRTLKMTRAVVPFDTAFGYRRTGETSWQYKPDPALPIAYVRVANINVSTLHDLRKLEPKLQADGAKAIVLDLRRCVGDLPNTALVADGLLDGGVIWRLRDKNGNIQEQTADRDCLFRGWPMVVLVDRGTLHGTSVILAAALHDNRKAIVVGETTAPVGQVRSLVSLPNQQGAVLLTTSFLERGSATVQPTEGTPKLWTVKPDHEAKLDRRTTQAVVEWQRAQESPDAPATNSKPPDDAALAKALDVLKTSLNAGGTQ